MSEDQSLNDQPIKIKYIQRIVRDCGRVDIYFRKGGYREGPLVSPDGTQALKDEVDAIINRLTIASEAAVKPKVGTVGGMMKDYNHSAEFLVLARSTQGEYQTYIDEIIADCGEILLADVTRSWVISMRNAWALRGHRASANRVQVLKNALSPIIDDDTDHRIKGDPFHKVTKAKPSNDDPEPHLRWEQYEFDAGIALALERNKPGLARALALGRYGGFRRGTICKIPLFARVTGFDEDGNPEPRLTWLTEKRKVMCDKREDPRLSEILNSTPNRAFTIAYNADGNQWKERQLNQAIDRLMATLARQGKVRAAVAEDGEIYSPLDIHGLRHTRGVELAEAGASDSGIMTQLEHKTTQAAAIYRRQANRRKMADTAQDQVDNVEDLKARRAAKKATAQK